MNNFTIDKLNSGKLATYDVVTKEEFQEADKQITNNFYDIIEQIKVLDKGLEQVALYAVDISVELSTLKEQLEEFQKIEENRWYNKLKRFFEKLFYG